MRNKKKQVLSVFLVFFLLSAMSLFGQGRYKVVYSSNEKGSEDINVIILDENLTILEKRPLIAWPTNENFPIWSKDGKWIAFHSAYDGTDSIWIMDEYGKNLRKFPNNSGLVDNPYVWNLDGKSIYGIHASAGDGEVAQFDLITEEVRMLTYLQGLNTQSFDVNYNQTKVTFVRGVEGNGWSNQLYIADFISDGTDFLNKHPVPEAGPAPHWPQFSPDGTRIVFTIESYPQDQNIGLGMVNADGTNFWIPVPQAYNQFILHPKWLDDNRLLISIGPRETAEIYVLDLNTMVFQRITYTPYPFYSAWPDVYREKTVDLKLINSNGVGLPGGIAKYYDGGWKDFGITDAMGKVSKVLDPGSYTFRMIYEGASIDKTVKVDKGSTVIFQTTNVTAQLKNSNGYLIDTGTIKYYAGSWRDFGVTAGGQASKEILPGSYTFRMIYEGTSNDKVQNIGSDPTVIFQTVNVAVQLKNSGGSPMDTGIAKYYAGSWRDFGTTVGGQANKELLGGSYTFRMTYEGTSFDKTQSIGNSPIVVFHTVNTIVQLKNSMGDFFDTGTVKYYAGSWRDFGITSSGQASKELLPGTYTFRMIYLNATNDKTQNIASIQIIEFQTGKVISETSTCTKFYAGAWQTFLNGMELLPVKYTFRFSDGTADTQYTIAAGTANIIH